MAAPLDVTALFVTVSGSGMSDITKTIMITTPGAGGYETIGDIPQGSGRTLTVDARDADGASRYHGEEIGITIVAGMTTDVGPVVMAFYGSTPPACR